MSGDANADGDRNLLDILYMIDAIYGTGDDPVPWASGDVNCDGDFNLLDILYLIDAVYNEGDDPCYYIP